MRRSWVANSAADRSSRATPGSTSTAPSPLPNALYPAYVPRGRNGTAISSAPGWNAAPPSVMRLPLSLRWPSARRPGTARLTSVITG